MRRLVHAAIYAALCDGNEFKPGVVGGGFGFDVLHLESAQVIREFRGRGLGLLMCQEALLMFEAGCGASVIEPHPIRRKFRRHHTPDAAWDAAMSWDALASTEEQFAAGAKRLRAHWKRLGFIPVPESTKFMYRDTSRRPPRLNEDALRKQMDAIDKEFGDVDDDDDE